jgi:hypothetical protein
MTEGGLVFPTTLQLVALETGGGGGDGDDSGVTVVDMAFVLVNMADNRSRAAKTAGD